MVQNHSHLLRLGTVLAILLLIVALAWLGSIWRLDLAPGDMRAQRETHSLAASSPQLDLGATRAGEDATPAREPAGSTESAVITIGGSLLVGIDGEAPIPLVRGGLSWGVTPPASAGMTEARVGVPTDVIDGRWSLTIDRRALIEPQKVTSFEGRFATPHNHQLLAEQANGMTIIADWDRGILLHILDRDDFTPLQRVRLYLASFMLNPGASDMPADAAYPDRTSIEQGPTLEHDSPIQIPFMLGTEMGWVVAPGHAWRRFTFSGSQGELTVLLERGGDLECTVVGLPPELAVVGLPSVAKGCFVRVRRANADEDLVAHTLLRQDGSFHFQNLPVGPVYVSAERLGPPQLDSFLGRVSTILSPGFTAIAVIDLHDSKVLGDFGSLTVSIRGEKESPDFPPLTALVIRSLEKSGSLLPHPTEIPPGCLVRCGEDHSYRWSSPSLLPGSYSIEALPSLAGKTVRIERGEQEHVELEVPSLCSVKVYLLLTENGELDTNGSVRIRPVGWEDPRSGIEASVDYRERCYSARCGPGHVTLSAGTVGHTRQVEEVELKPGENTITMDLVRAPVPCTIKMHAVQGLAECPLPLDNGWAAVKFSPLGSCTGKRVGLAGGTQYGMRMWFDTSTCTIQVDQPGEYLVQFPRLRGFLAVPDAKVRAEVGRETEFVVDLLPN